MSNPWAPLCNIVRPADHAVPLDSPNRWNPGGGPSSIPTDIGLLPKRIRILLAAEWVSCSIQICKALGCMPSPLLRVILDDVLTWVTTGNPTKGLLHQHTYKDIENGFGRSYNLTRLNAACCCVAGAVWDMLHWGGGSGTSYLSSCVVHIGELAGDQPQWPDRERWQWMYKTYRAAVGSGIEFQESWRTSTAVAIAKEAWDTLDFSSMPILADALQDAGCDNLDVITHLQTPALWTQADWVIWNLLDLGGPVRTATEDDWGDLGLGIRLSDLTPDLPLPGVGV